MVGIQGTKLVLHQVVAVADEEELVPVPVEDIDSELLVDKDHPGKMAAEPVSAVAVAVAEEAVLAVLASHMDLTVSSEYCEVRYALERAGASR